MHRSCDLIEREDGRADRLPDRHLDAVAVRDLLREAQPFRIDRLSQFFRELDQRGEDVRGGVGSGGAGGRSSTPPRAASFGSEQPGRERFAFEREDLVLDLARIERRPCCEDFLLAGRERPVQPPRKQERLIQLMNTFGEILSSHAAFRGIFGPV